MSVERKIIPFPVTASASIRHTGAEQRTRVVRRPDQPLRPGERRSSAIDHHWVADQRQLHRLHGSALGIDVWAVTVNGGDDADGILLLTSWCEQLLVVVPAFHYP